MSWSRVGWVALLVVVVSTLGAGRAGAANPPLTAVGPASPVHPFPLWYQDSNLLKLEPCLDTTPQPGFATGLCGLAAGVGAGLVTPANPAATFNPANPVTYPDNFPGTVIYGSVNGELPLAGNARGLVYTAQLIGTFNPLAGGFDPNTPQVVTSIKMTSTVTMPAGTYTITHPYGVLTITTTAAGDLCNPANNGGRNPCNLRFPVVPVVGTAAGCTGTVLGTCAGGVLTANTNPGDPTLGTFMSMVGAPLGFAGDGASRTQVTGSPTVPAQNFIRIEGPVGAPPAGFACTNGVATNCIENNGLAGRTGLTVTGKKVDPAHSPGVRFVVTGLTNGGAGVPQLVTVAASDVNGNPATGYSGTVHFTSSDPQATLPADSTLLGGVGTFSVTPRTVGPFTVTATDTLSPSFAGSQTASITPGPAASLAVRSLAATSPAGVATAFQVLAVDQFGNTDTGYTGTVSFTSDDPQAILPPPTGITLGQGSVSATFKTAKLVTLTASAPPALLGTALITVLPGPAASLALVSGGSQSGTVGAALGAPFVAKVSDAFGNGVAGVLVAFAAPAGGSIGTPVTSAADGTVSATGTLPTTPGPAVFTAAAAGLTGSPLAFPATAVAGLPVGLAIAGLPGTVTAGVSQALTIAALDQFGNVSTGASGLVALSSTDPQAVLPVGATLTLGVGSATVALRTAGARSVSAVLAASPGVSGTASSNVVSAPAATLAAFSGSGQSGTAGQPLASPLVVAAADAFSNPVSGVVVTFAAPVGASIAPATVTTGADGRASATGRLSQTTGPQTFTASAAGLSGSPVSFAATGLPATPTSIAITGLGPSVTAGTTTALTATVRDAFNNTVTTFNGTAAVSSTDPVATLAPVAVAIVNGVGAFSATLKTAGGRSVTAQVVSPALSGTTGTTVLPAAAATITSVSGGGQRGTVGAALAAPFVILVTDAFGNAVPGASVTFAAATAGAVVVAPATVATGAAGTASASGVLPTLAGAAAFTAASAGLAGSPVAFAATATPDVPATLAVSGLPGAVTAGAAAPFTVSAADRFGNLATNFAGALRFASSDAAATLPATASLTGGVSGALAATFRTAGLRSLTAAVVAAPAVAGSASTTVAPTAAASIAVVSGAGQTGTVALALAQPFVVKVTDPFGNGVAGTAVSFAAPATGSVTVAAPTAADGTTSATGTLGHGAGAQTFTATAGTLAGSPVSFAATATAGTAASLAAVSGNNQSGTVGLALALPFVVKVTDAFGNAVAGAAVTFTAPATGSVTVAAPTAADGTTSATGTLPSASGAATFSASAAGVAGAPSFTAQASPGAPTTLAMTGLPTSVTAGVAAPVSLAASDKFGNACTNFSGPVSFTSSDPAFAPPSASLTLGIGTANVTLVTVGARTVTATLASIPAATSTQSTNVVAGSASALALVSGTGQTGTVGAALAQPFVVKVSDLFGNPVAGTTVLFTAPATGSVTVAAPTAADGTTSAVGTLGHAAGAQTFTARSGTLAGSPVSLSVTASAGAPASLTVAGLPTSVPAGVTSTLTVTALDAFGNMATGSSAALTLASTDPAAVLPAAPALAAGLAALPVTLKTTGARSVTVSTAGATSLTVNTTVTPATTSSIVLVSSPASATVGSAAGTATVEVKDTLGNVVPNATVTFAATSGGSIAPATALTDAAGRASATPTVGKTVGSYTFTAGVASVTPASFTITAGPGAADHLALTPRPAPGPVLDCGTYDVDVQLQDGFGNTVPGALAGVTVTASGSAIIASADLTPAAGFGGFPTASVTGALRADGGAVLHVSDGKPESATLTASAGPPVATASASLTWTLGPVDAGKSVLITDASRLVAWSGHGHLTLRPSSACGNPLGAGQQVSFGLAGPGVLTPTVDVGDGSYTASLNVTPCPATGATQVTARVNGVDLAPLSVTVVCVAPSPTRTGVALDRLAVPMCNDPKSNQVAVVVTPRDDAGNPLGAGDTVSLAMEGLAGGAVQDRGDGTYAAAFSAATCSAAPRQLTVRVNGVDIARPADMTLGFPCAPVDASTSGVSASASSAVADGRSQIGLTVAATNTCGEPARGHAVQLASDLGVLSVPAGATDDAGTWASTLTSLTAGTATVMASVDGVALAPRTVTFTAPPPPTAKSGGCGSGPGGFASVLGLLAAASLACRRRARVKVKNLPSRDEGISQAPESTSRDTYGPPRLPTRPSRKPRTT